MGEANDYVGKSMHGGSITVKTCDNVGFTAEESAIVGNTCLYGATGGRFYANGRAGERFCVRNSNAVAVIEATGDHCCEYMTGGAVVVLGEVGRNVGAGRTGGWGYFLDEEKDGYNLPSRINSDVNVQRVNDIGAAQLKELIEDHVKATGSKKGQAVLDDWDNYLPKFWHVYPSSEANAPEVSGVRPRRRRRRVETRRMAAARAHRRGARHDSRRKAPRHGRELRECGCIRDASVSYGA